MENYNFICHIIGLNLQTKKKIEELKNQFNIIDLDIINQKIISDEYLDKLYTKYEKLKKDKNDKFKDIDKKMTLYWENTFLEKINELASTKIKNIFIGYNYHYKNINKKINLNTCNNFIIKNDLNDEIKSIIQKNLDNNREKIINGNFPLEYLDFNFLLKKKENLLNTYIKMGYIEKDFDDIINILETLNKTKDKSGLWICLKDQYNVDSKIYPKNNTILAYSEPEIALIESFEFNNDEIQTNIITENDTSSLSIKEIKPNSLEKLKKKRFLYYVDNESFLPFENNSTKYFTQVPVSIKLKEKVENAYTYLSI